MALVVTLLLLPAALAATHAPMPGAVAGRVLDAGTSLHDHAHGHSHDDDVAGYQLAGHDLADHEHQSHVLVPAQHALAVGPDDDARARGSAGRWIEPRAGPRRPPRLSVG
ncbi:MAG: hypothetical protein RQ752_04635 [Thermohalobaculum sp.]|nr:hypothetical protein [Thermohalobaculum sp.]